MYKSYFEPNDASCIIITTPTDFLALGFRDSEGGNLPKVLAAAAADVAKGDFPDVHAWLAQSLAELVENCRPIKVIRATAYALWLADGKPGATGLSVDASMLERRLTDEPMKRVVGVHREACEAAGLDMLEITRHPRKTQLKMRLALPELKLPSAFLGSCLPAHMVPAVDNIVRGGVMKTVGNKGFLDLVLRHP